MPLISVCCITYNRPDLLGETIASFEQQTVPKEVCEMIILDDGGQYEPIRGANWKLISFPHRFRSIGEKRNACAALCSLQSDYIVCTDDDDIYLPHWLECHLSNAEKGLPFSFCPEAYELHENICTKKPRYASDCFRAHVMHAYSRELFYKAGYYPAIAGSEDYDFFDKVLAERPEHIDCLNGRQPFFLYREFRSVPHATGIDLATLHGPRYPQPPLPPAKLEIGWRHDYQKIVDDWEREHGI
jgi:glycosyltransferase involved in cell wall biosynthesis